MKNDQIIILAGKRTGSHWVTEVCGKHLNYSWLNEPSNSLNAYLSNKVTIQDIQNMYRDLFAVPPKIRAHYYLSKKDIKDSKGYIFKETAPLIQIVKALEDHKDKKIIFLIRDFFSRAVSWKNFANDVSNRRKWARNVSSLDIKNFSEMIFKDLCCETNAFFNSSLPKNIFYYEHLYLYPEKEFKRMFSLLDYPDVEVDKQILKIPSNSATESSLIKQGKDQITGWRDQITPEMREIGDKIIKEYGLDHLYNEEGMPNEKLG